MPKVDKHDESSFHERFFWVASSSLLLVGYLTVYFLYSIRLTDFHFVVVVNSILELWFCWKGDKVCGLISAFP